MTAITAVWRLDGKPDGDAAVARMLDAQAAYGPDGAAAWADGPIAMGRALWRLLPEDAHDLAPVQGSSGCVGVADVRIDNRDELLDALGAPKPGPGQLSDAAVLLAAFERWGDAAFARIAGDFACAIWDPRARRLTLARDCVGARPLHYHAAPGLFAAASMPKGLHALAEIPRAADLDVAAEQLALLAPYGERSFFAGVRSVKSGHVLAVSETGIAVRRYWDPPCPGRERLSADDYAEGLRAHLDAAVRARLRGTGGRVGSQLSAGLDSSAVTTAAANVMADAGGRVTAFTATPRPGYPTPCGARAIFDEGPLAARTAALYPNIEHVLIPGEARSPFELLDLADACDRPILGLYNLAWLDRLHRDARSRGLSVMLTGDMGNATISYAGIERLPALLRAGRWPTLLAELAALVRQKRARPLGALALALAPFLPAAPWQALARARGQTADLTAHAPLRDDVIRRLDLRRRVRQGRRASADGYDVRLRMIELSDLGNHRKGYLAAWGVDQRDPTADRRLIEFCLAAPMEQFLRDGVPRSLARRAFADRWPPELLAERRRGWQAADWHEGLEAGRAQAAAEVARIAASPAAASVLDARRLAARIEAWPKDWSAAETVLAYREGLIRAIALGDFIRRAAGDA